MTLDVIKDLPLPESMGTPVECELLAGMGYGRAYKVETEKGVFVLKGAKEQRERLFYERIAPLVNAAGVPTPELLWSYQDDALSWVALEWLPRILPESRWQVDDEVFEKLALLHNLDIDLNGILPETIQWTGEMNQLALSVSPRNFAEVNKSRLEDLCSRFQYLFELNYFLSGDPSGRNWGIRENGQLVLFDWERFGFGMPQLDLADVAFGEPPVETFREIAHGYLKHNPIEPDIEKFTMEIQVARIHRCISMLSSHAKGIGHVPPRIIEFTVTGLGQLLNRVEK
jgi:thiamine kinase-like enzyme